MPSMMLSGNKTSERFWGYENGTLMNNIGVPPTYPKDCFVHPPLLWLRFILRISQK